MSVIGGPRPHLVFSHANGFPAPTYRKLLARLRDRFDVSGIERFGHAPGYSVSRGWPGLTRQLLDHIDALPVGTHPWLVGHSLGGYVSILAAGKLGKRVAGVVLLDSPLIGGWPERMVKLGRRLGFDRHLMPLEQTRQRCTQWPDAAAAHAHFAGKRGFSGWDPDVLRDYAQHATVCEPEGTRRLLFDRDVEHSIYATLPTASVRTAAAKLLVPVALIAGTRSREMRLVGLGASRRVVGDRLRWIEGGHLFPMERPLQTAELVADAIAGMAGSRAAA